MTSNVATKIECVVEVADATPTSMRSKASWLTNSTTRLLVLVFISSMVVGTRCGHNLLAQPFKKDLGIDNLRMPWFLCVVTMASFPISILIWVFWSRGRPNIPRWNSKRMRAFIILAALDALNTALGMIGLAALPAAVFTIIKGSSIIFVVIISKIFTSKKFNVYHYFGVVLMAVGVSLAAGSGSSKSGTVVDGFVSVLCSLGSAFFMALLCVAQQILLGKEKEKGGLEVVLQINAFQSTFSFIFLLPFILLSSECAQWPSYIDTISSTGHLSVFIGISVALFVMRPLNLFCNMLVVSICSATASRALGAPRRVVIVILGYFIFGQRIGPTVIVSCALVTISFCVYIYGGVIVSRQKSKRKSCTDSSSSGTANTGTTPTARA